MHTYPELLQEVKDRIREAQVQATMSANAELLLMYWDVGRIIAERRNAEGWGSKVIQRLSRDIRNDLPEVKGFSERNLKRMQAFYKEYQDLPFGPTPLAQMPEGEAIGSTPLALLEKNPADNERARMLRHVFRLPWAHNVALLGIKETSARLWYMAQTLEQGWSHDRLMAQIKSNAHERHGRTVTNFTLRLPPPQSAPAQEALKDFYFRWDVAGLAEPLASVRHKQGLLLGRMQALGFPIRAEAGLETLTADVVTSSAIEGERLDPAQVRSSLAQRLGIEIGGLTPVSRYVEGIVSMVLDATQHYDTPLTADRLFGWHGALFPTGYGSSRRITVGAWRTAASGPMQVVSGYVGREKVHLEAPAAERLDVEMGLFLDWFNAPLSLDPVLKAALAHLWFVSIHPFEDGNGRIARAIADCVLARADACPPAFLQYVPANRDRTQSLL